MVNDKKRGIMSLEAQRRLIEGARKGGKASKHFTQESKERQISGARRGGIASAGTIKHYSEESKERQIAGARRGGEHSHIVTRKINKLGNIFD